MMKFLFSFLFLFALIFAGASKAVALDYKVVRVIDGDTFIATDGSIEFKVRIVGMDAPESKQDYGKVAKTFLTNLIDDQTVTLQPLKKPLDRYNRILAQVFWGEQDVAKLMIAQGLAYYYRPTCQDYPIDKKKYDFAPTEYVEVEAEAQQKKIGLWTQSERLLPCEYRKLHPYR